MFPAHHPVALPSRPRRSWLIPVLSTLLVLTALIAVGGGATAVSAAGGGAAGGGARFVAEQRADVRDQALRSLLERRAKAVHDKDRAAFLADVDGHDTAFVRRQTQEFDNLTKLPLAEFRYQLQETSSYGDLVPPAVRSRFDEVVRAVGVTILYRIDGIDSEPVAAPWVPVFGAAAGRWRLAAVAGDARLPTGTNGQAWDAGPIAIARSARVVLVLSADDAGRAAEMLDMAEDGLDHVAAVRRGAWAGKVLITAVQDAKLFTTYFGQSPDRIDSFAAIAVPYYAGIPDWGAKRTYAATRIVFNPHEFGADPEELAHDLTHEFAHAAMGPVTSDDTPLWVVEGYAEYVAFKPRDISGSYARRSLEGFPTGSQPPGADFYADGRNYVLGWLACRMIAQRYGEAKLTALYEYFTTHSRVDEALRQVLGVEQSAFDAQYVSYVEKARTGSLP